MERVIRINDENKANYNDVLLGKKMIYVPNKWNPIKRIAYDWR